MWWRFRIKANWLYSIFVLTLRSVTFSPEVELTINYCGKRVQMSHGPIMGLIMGLGQLNCSKIKLKKINYRRGLLGIDRVLHYLIKEWLNHIKKRQLPSLLQGIGPMHSIVIFCKFWNVTHFRHDVSIDHSIFPQSKVSSIYSVCRTNNISVMDALCVAFNLAHKVSPLARQ